MEDLENTLHSDSSEDFLEKRNFLIKFWQRICLFIKQKIMLFYKKTKAGIFFVHDKLEQISFWRAVTVGLALGFFIFGMMIFAAALWLVR